MNHRFIGSGKVHGMKLFLKKANISSDSVRASNATWNTFTAHVLQVPTFGQAMCSLSISKTIKPVNVVFELLLSYRTFEGGTLC